MLTQQVSELIGRFTEGSGERDAPVHALRKALHLIAADCKASYARWVLFFMELSLLLHAAIKWLAR